MSESTEIINKAKDVIDTMLGYLGFVVQVEEDNTHPGGGLHIFTKEAEVLIGKDGKRLEDIQYLINRIVHQHYPKAKRLRIDIEHYRSMQDDALVQRVDGAVAPLTVEALQATEAAAHSLRLELEETRFREREASGAQQQAQNYASVTGTFKEMTYWNHDTAPSGRDYVPQAMRWFEVARKVHAPLPLEAEKNSEDAAAVPTPAAP